MQVDVSSSQAAQSRDLQICKYHVACRLVEGFLAVLLRPSFDAGDDGHWSPRHPCPTLISLRGDDIIRPKIGNKRRNLQKLCDTNNALLSRTYQTPPFNNSTYLPVSASRTLAALYGRGFVAPARASHVFCPMGEGSIMERPIHLFKFMAIKWDESHKGFALRLRFTMD